MFLLNYELSLKPRYFVFDGFNEKKMKTRTNTVRKGIRVWKSVYKMGGLSDKRFSEAVKPSAMIANVRWHIHERDLCPQRAREDIVGRQVPDAVSEVTTTFCHHNSYQPAKHAIAIYQYVRCNWIDVVYIFNRCTYTHVHKYKTLFAKIKMQKIGKWKVLTVTGRQNTGPKRYLCSLQGRYVANLYCGTTEGTNLLKTSNWHQYHIFFNITWKFLLINNKFYSPIYMLDYRFML